MRAKSERNVGTTRRMEEILAESQFNRNRMMFKQEGYFNLIEGFGSPFCHVSLSLCHARWARRTVHSPLLPANTSPQDDHSAPSSQCPDRVDERPGVWQRVSIPS